MNKRFAQFKSIAFQREFRIVWISLGLLIVAFVIDVFSSPLIFILAEAALFCAVFTLLFCKCL